MATKALDLEDPYVANILRVASARFAENGYHGTTMRDIAAAVGVQAGSLYVHIKSKEDLLLAIVSDVGARAQRQMDSILASSGGAAEKLGQVARSHLDLVVDRPDWSTVYFHEWRHLSPERRRAVETSRDQWEAGLRQILTEGTAAGVFREIDARMGTIAFVSMLNWTYRWLQPGGPSTPAEVADKFTDYILRGWLSGSSPGRVAGVR